MQEPGTPRRWLDIPLGRNARREVLTWGALAQRYERCLGCVASYVGKLVHDPGVLDRIVSEVLEQNLDLLVAEHDEHEELRRLRATADRLIATCVAVLPDGHGS